MSISVGAYEAKTHFSELLERVSKGETITVTKHGLPVAQLRPVTASHEDEARQAVEDIQALSAGIHVDGLSIRDLMYEGRH